MIRICMQDRLGRGWETGWTRKGDKVTLTDEPETPEWERLPEPVRTATIDYHRAIATARAKAEHKATRNSILYEPQNLPIRAVRFRGDLDSLQHILTTLLGLDIDPTVGAARRTVQATTRTRLSFTRHLNGAVALTLVKSGGAGAVTVGPGNYLYVDYEDRLDQYTETEFNTLYRKAGG